MQPNIDGIQVYDQKFKLQNGNINLKGFIPQLFQQSFNNHFISQIPQNSNQQQINQNLSENNGLVDYFQKGQNQQFLENFDFNFGVQNVQQNQNQNNQNLKVLMQDTVQIENQQEQMEQENQEQNNQNNQNNNQQQQQQQQQQLQNQKKKKRMFIKRLSDAHILENVNIDPDIGQQAAKKPVITGQFFKFFAKIHKFIPKEQKILEGDTMQKKFKNLFVIDAQEKENKDLVNQKLNKRIQLLKILEQNYDKIVNYQEKFCRGCQKNIVLRSPNIWHWHQARCAKRLKELLVMEQHQKEDVEKLTPNEFEDPPQENPEWKTYECKFKKYHLLNDLENDPNIKKEYKGDILEIKRDDDKILEIVKNKVLKVQEDIKQIAKNQCFGYFLMLKKWNQNGEFAKDIQNKIEEICVGKLQQILKEKSKPQRKKRKKRNANNNNSDEKSVKKKQQLNNEIQQNWNLNQNQQFQQQQKMMGGVFNRYKNVNLKSNIFKFNNNKNLIINSNYIPALQQQSIQNMYYQNNSYNYYQKKDLGNQNNYANMELERSESQNVNNQKKNIILVKPPN